MIKFFRHIRQKLLSEGKTTRYLTYAIGEIILVVIGILIALQINNYNQQRKDRAKEQTILKHLKEDYTADLQQIEEKMAMRKVIVNSAYKLFYAMDHPDEIIRDSLIHHIVGISDFPTFDPIENDLISSGNLRLITNERLTRLLSNWSSDIVSLKEIEADWAKIINEQFEPAMGQLGIARDLANCYMSATDHLWYLDHDVKPTHSTIGNSKVSTPSSEIISSKILEGLVSSAITYNEPGNIQSEALVKRIHEILNLIDSEIKEE